MNVDEKRKVVVKSVRWKHRGRERGRVRMEEWAAVSADEWGGGEEKDDESAGMR